MHHCTVFKKNYIFPPTSQHSHVVRHRVRVASTASCCTVNALQRYKMQPCMCVCLCVLSCLSLCVHTRVFTQHTAVSPWTNAFGSFRSGSGAGFIYYSVWWRRIGGAKHTTRLSIVFLCTVVPLLLSLLLYIRLQSMCGAACPLTLCRLQHTHFHRVAMLLT